MKTLFTLLAFSLGLSVKTFAQAGCNPSIPASAVVIKTNTTNTSSTTTRFWVCKGATLTDNGNANDIIYLESGATLKGTGNGTITIYVPGGATVNYTGNGSGPVYYVNVSDLISTKYSTLHQCTSITYDYTNAPANGCPTCVSSGAMPTSISSSTGSSFCAGKSSTLTQVGGTLNTGAHWQWSTDSCKGTVIGTGDSVVVTPTATTTYFVKTIGDSCYKSCISITLTLTTNTCVCTNTGADPVSISSSTGTSACAGKPTTLSETGGALNTGAQWAWSTGSCAGTVIDSGASIVVSPTAATTYFVKAIRDACHPNCSSISLNPVSILTPVINGPNFSSSVLLCPWQTTTLTVVNSPCTGGGCTYNWSPGFPGDTGISVSVTPQTVPITYTVTLSNACKDSSKGTFTINLATGCATGVAALSGNADGISIIPNPSHGEFTILFPAGITDKPLIRIYNLFGSEVSFSSRENKIIPSRKEISLEDKAEGIYFIQVTTEQKSFTRKIIIQK